jgi:hypothetical protein
VALIGNYSVLNKSAAQFTNGTSTAGAYAAITPSNYQKNGMKLNRFSGPVKFADHSAIPNGYIPPYSFALPKISGGLASYKGISAEISTTEALLALGINIDSNMSASMTETDAILALIVALNASITASGSITDANMAIIILLEAALSSTGQFTNAELKNILNLASSLAATGTLTNSITNLVNLSADISNSSGGITNESVAAAVWEALAADYNAAGSMGEKLNDAGSAGNPWAADLASNNTAGTFGGFVQKLLTVAKFLGLK